MGGKTEQKRDELQRSGPRCLTRNQRPGAAASVHGFQISGFKKIRFVLCTQSKGNSCKGHVVEGPSSRCPLGSRCLPILSPGSWVQTSEAAGRQGAAAPTLIARTSLSQHTACSLHGLGGLSVAEHPMPHQCGDGGQAAFTPCVRTHWPVLCG